MSVFGHSCALQVRDNDVWIISYPKCGTTWTQEMVWMLGNNLDYETGSKVDLSDRSPFFELVHLNSKESISHSLSPISQLIFIQLPLSLLYIIVCENELIQPQYYWQDGTLCSFQQLTENSW